MMRSFLNVLLALLCVITISPQITYAEGQRPKVVTNVAGDRPSLLQTVSLIRTNERISRGSAVSVQGLEGGHGSGTYIEHGGHYGIVTARHVIDRAEIFYVATDSEKVVAQVVWKSETHDIAVLRVPKLDSRRAISLPRGNDDLMVGEQVVYSGYPASYDMITTRAYVSGYEPEYKATLLHGFVWFGYSGSGVFDDTGTLVGIVVAIGVERYGNQSHVLEDMVYIHELKGDHVTRIKHALR